MKAKLIFNNGWNLEFENLNKSSLFYWWQLHPYYWRIKTIKDFNRFREIREFVTYDSNEVNFTGDLGRGFIRRR